jgi:hypothetical protein
MKHKRKLLFYDTVRLSIALEGLSVSGATLFMLQQLYGCLNTARSGERYPHASPPPPTTGALDKPGEQ